MRRIDLMVDCGNCGKTFKTIPAYIRKGGGKFCSQDCYHKSPSFLNGIRKGGRTVGNLIAKGVVKRNLATGERHWAWNPNRTEQLEKHRLRSTKEWRDWRKAIFERDNYTCQECKRNSSYLEPHHVIPIRSDIGLVFEINNGIALCRPCHQKTVWKEEQFSEKYSRIISEHVATQLH